MLAVNSLLRNPAFMLYFLMPMVMSRNSELVFQSAAFRVQSFFSSVGHESWACVKVELRENVCLAIAIAQNQRMEYLSDSTVYEEKGTMKGQQVSFQ